jgi:hypothetical protein
MDILRRSAIFTLTISMVGCAPSTSPGPATDKETNQVTKLIISKREEGRAVPIGTLSFDPSNKATLTIDKPGPDGEALKQNWEQLSRQDHLTWKRAVPQTINGEQVTAIEGTDVKRSDKDYRWAVLDNLERKYNYSVESREN